MLWKDTQTSETRDHHGLDSPRSRSWDKTWVLAKRSTWEVRETAKERQGKEVSQWRVGFTGYHCGQQELMSPGETREDGAEHKPQHYPTQGAIELGYLYTSSYRSWVESYAQEPLSTPGTFSLLSAAGHRNGNCQQDTGQSRAAGCGCYTHIKRFTVWGEGWPSENSLTCAMIEACLEHKEVPNLRGLLKEVT